LRRRRGVSFQRILTPNLKRLSRIKLAGQEIGSPSVLMFQVPMGVGVAVRMGQPHMGRDFSRAHRAKMMSGYLQCACSASFQNLQLWLQKQQGRKPALLCVAHLLTVMNDSPLLPHAGGQEKLWGLCKWLQAKTGRLFQATGRRKKSSLPID
jgi:hypothetical protein